MSTPEQPAAYATCNDCGIDLADRDAVNAHTGSTLTPTSAGGSATSHRVRIVNPTEDERRAQRLRMRISDALADLYAELDRGEFTAAEVADELRWYDLADGWEEYVA